MKPLKDLGVEIVGVSGDTVETQALFKKVHKLPYTLLADSDGAVGKALGVKVKKGGTVKKNIDGKDYEFTRGVTESRWTFVIGKDGKIAYKNTKVKPGKDSKMVLDVVRQLK